MLKVGNIDIAKIYAGDTPIKKVYAGSDLVWPTAHPLPYDYEVEYIQRDTSIYWKEGGTNVIGGFNIFQYVPPGQTMQNASKCSVTWSFDNNTGNVFYAFRYLANLFASLMMWKRAGNNLYSFISGSSYSTSVVGDINVYHTQSIIPLGNGKYQFLMDGVLFNEFTSTSTLQINAADVMSGGATTGATGDVRFRVKRMTFADSVYLIPVVKGNQMGFYNTIDGQLFLAEQACLSAGPRIN